MPFPVSEMTRELWKADIIVIEIHTVISFLQGGGEGQDVAANVVLLI
jgi:hypothetical protein